MDYGNFETHLRRVQDTVYAENETTQHALFTRKAIEGFVVPYRQEIKDVLDVGCGRGPALADFTALGFNATGITLSDEDRDACIGQGFKVEKQDMSFMSFGDSSFDLIWARHCLEHSPMPIITLFELERVARPGKYLYVEVPQDDSPHIDNPNHYSVLSDRAWQSLLRRTEFQLKYRGQWVVQIGDWIDLYWYYWLKKKT